MLVGEVYLFDPVRLAAYLEPGELHMAHNFIVAQLPVGRGGVPARRSPPHPAPWPAWFLGNHDMSRPASRLGRRQARAALLLLYSLRGTPFIYQGEELGLPDAYIPAERVVDVDGRDPRADPDPLAPRAGAWLHDRRAVAPVRRRRRRAER